MVDANTTTKAAKTVFTPLMEDVSKFGNSAKDLGKNAAAAFGRAGESGAGSFLGRIAVAPVRVVVKVARWPIAMASGIFKHAGPVGVVATIAGTALGATALLRNRAERRTQENAMSEVIAAQQAAAPVYGLAPGEFDAKVAPLMRGGEGLAQAGHVNAVNAAREQAATGTAVGA